MTHVSGGASRRIRIRNAMVGAASLSVVALTLSVVVGDPVQGAAVVATSGPTAVAASSVISEVPTSRSAIKNRVLMAPRVVAAGKIVKLRLLGKVGVPAKGVRAVTAQVAAAGRRGGAVAIWSTGQARPTRPTITIGKSRTATRTLTIGAGRSGSWSLQNPTRQKIVVTVNVLSYINSHGVSILVSGTDEGVAGSSAGSASPLGLTTSDLGRYEIGAVTVRDIWVDPVGGSDGNTGSTRSTALRSVHAAWALIPQSRALATGYRIQLVAGTYGSSSLVNYWENRRGTRAFPIILNAVDGSHTVTFTGDINLFNTSYFYVLGVDIVRAGDAFHCERCSYVLLRDMELSGGNRAAHETVKFNQSDHVYLEDSDIHGAEDNAIDFVAVQYGHIIGNKIHDAQDWCAYTKGGSAYVTVAENEIFDCDGGGFTAGQGTGFEFMTSPWLHYEAYDIRVINNVIHDTARAGLGVNGGYNVLLAYNTLIRVGSFSHAVEFVFGARGCDGDATACAANHNLGGWGSAQSDSGSGFIPNRHVYFYNNVINNPQPFQSDSGHFAVYGPRTPLSGNTLTGPQYPDNDLQIAGNVVWNGPPTLSLVDGSGCAQTNPTCNLAQLRAANAINTTAPQLDSSFRPSAGGNLDGGEIARLATAIPSFGWSDAPTPPAVPMRSDFGSNLVPRNIAGEQRAGWGRPGAY